jgi:hypothetical protein
MMYENLNGMKKVKLYSIESVIDNSLFKNYTLLNISSVKYVNQLYELQRNYDIYIYPISSNLASNNGNLNISSLVHDSLCTNSSI